jgi:hypothetical protein
MSFYKRLNDLEKVSNSLKSRLLHEQLKWNTYNFIHLKKEMLLILKEYGKHNSITKAASDLGIDGRLAVKWYLEGQNGNPHFKAFYLAISKSRSINNFKHDSGETLDLPDYNVESVGGSWIYTADVDGKKISVISSDYEQLKKRISEKNLPFQ